MGYILSALGVGGSSGAGAAGAGASAGTAASAGAGAGTAATAGAGAAGLGESAALSLGIGKAAAESAPDLAPVSKGLDLSPQFNDVVKPGIDMITKDTTASTLATLNKPSFMEEVGNFGKDFGLEIARNLVQNSLSRIPGGRTIGSYVGRAFDNPSIKGLFSTQDDEISQRDALIKVLLKQRLGKA